MYEEAIARRTKRHLKEGHWKAFLLALLEEKKREEKGRRSNFVVGVGQDAKQPEWPNPPLLALVGVCVTAANFLYCSQKMLHHNAFQNN
jgi:hypothetical protein